MTGHAAPSTQTAAVAGGWTGPLLSAQGVSRTFGAGETAVQALRDVTIDVPRGQLLVVRGRSGSGKTTLLNCLGGLETPDTGHVLLSGDDLATMSSDSLVQMRRHRIGYIFQSFGLLPILSAAENVGVPMRLRRAPLGGTRAPRGRTAVDGRACRPPPPASVRAVRRPAAARGDRARPRELS